MQPRKVKLDQAPRRCPACGREGARLVRLDHYFSLFFIPLLPVKRGEPYLECPHCGPLQGRAPGRAAPRPSRCPTCGRPLQPDFDFCPGCGRRL